MEEENSNSQASVSNDSLRVPVMGALIWRS